MDEMREIVTVAQMEHLFRLLAVLAPLVGLALGAAIGARRGALRPGAIGGLVVGLLGPLNWLLWRMYNGLTDRMGLDTVKNLLVNLAIFVALGVGAGLALGYRARRQAKAADRAAPPEPRG